MIRFVALFCCFIFVNSVIAQEITIQDNQPQVAQNEHWDFVNHTDGERSVLKIVIGKKLSNNTFIQFGHGTGVAIHKTDKYTFIVTACHVVTGTNDIIAVTHEGKRFSAKICCFDCKNDVALIMISGNADVEVMELTDKYPQPSEKVEGIGWGWTAKDKPRHWEFSVLPGSSEHDMLYSDGPFQNGDSGGAITYKKKLVSLMLNGCTIYNDRKCVGPGRGCKLSVLKNMYNYSVNYK